MKPEDTRRILEQAQKVILLTRIGQHFTDKWRQRLAEAGHAAVMAQMKKQGIPPEIAVAMLYTNAPQERT